MFAVYNIRLTRTLPEMQCKSLGMKVEIFDSAAQNIEETGQAGELVCTRPHPSLPIKFWGDDDQHTKYMAAYYSTYPGTTLYSFLCVIFTTWYLSRRVEAW